MSAREAARHFGISPLGLELVAPARRPAAATGYRSARADHTRGASRPGSASGHARALPRRGTGRRDRRLSARQRRPAARYDPDFGKLWRIDTDPAVPMLMLE